MAETTVLEHEELLQVQKPVSRLSWGGIIAGAIATIAIGILLMSLGAAIGLTGMNPAQAISGQPGEGISPIWSGIWTFLSIVVATFIGAWLGSRHSTLFVKHDAAAQGIVIWGLSFLLTLGYVGWAGGMIASTGSQLVGSTLQTAGSAAGAAAEQGQVSPEELQRDVQRQMPSGEEVRQGAAQVAEKATDVGAAVSWWFFVTALFSLVAGALGGLAGLPSRIRKQRLETRRHALRESRA